MRASVFLPPSFAEGKRVLGSPPTPGPSPARAEGRIVDGALPVRDFVASRHRGGMVGWRLLIGCELLDQALRQGWKFADRGPGLVGVGLLTG